MSPEIAAYLKSLNLTESDVSALSEKKAADLEAPKRVSMAHQQIDLSGLPRNVADVLSAFDYDGNGDVTVGEVQRGAELLKETKRKHKVALWALVIQFVVYAVLTAASSGALFYFLYELKDTNVDSATGNMMVKDGATNEDVEVTIKNHGVSVSSDFTATDSTTGLSKNCFYPTSVDTMFDTVAEGTTVSVVDEDLESGSFDIVPLNGKATITDNNVQIGELVLYPDLECTEMMNNIGANRLLSRGLRIESLLESHMAFKDELVASYKNGGNARGRRKLQAPTPSYAAGCYARCKGESDSDN